MSQQNSSPNVNRVVRLTRPLIHEAVPVARPTDHGGRRLNPAWSDLPDYSSDSVVPIAEANHPAVDLWWTALAFVVEGFAVYGASLHATAACPVQEILADAEVRRRRAAGGQQSLAASGSGGSLASENSKTIDLTRGSWTDARPPRRWSWLNSIGETAVTLWTSWHQERQIKRAVATLAQCDDRTLRDLGIGGRSDIERVVRYGRDY